MSAKIFVIGLPKSGTTSLHLALKTLGFRSIHFPHDRKTVHQLRRGDYRLDIMQQFDAASDTPIPAIFPQLDGAFPNSKFIHTVRPVDDWLKSQRNALFNSQPPKPGHYRDFYRTLLYGTNHFCEERFHWVYEDHQRRVEGHFNGNRSRDFLTINFGQTVAWKDLCTFLEVDEPNMPFPHANRQPAGTRSAQPSALARAKRLFRLRSVS